jgi:ribonuclease inhibitor
MNTITLDFSEIKSYLALHQYFKEVFNLPDYYGNNLDALWDCLYCYYDSSTSIELRNIDTMPKDLDIEVADMMKLFYDLERKNGVVIRIVNDNHDTTDLSGYLI